MLSIESAFLLPVPARADIFMHRICSVCFCSFPLAEIVDFSRYYQSAVNYLGPQKETTLIFLIILGN